MLAQVVAHLPGRPHDSLLILLELMHTHSFDLKQTVSGCQGREFEWRLCCLPSQAAPVLARTGSCWGNAKQSNAAQTQLKRVVMLDGKRWPKTFTHVGLPAYRGVWFSFWLALFHRHISRQWGIGDLQKWNLAMCLQNIPVCCSGTCACYSRRKYIMLNVQHTVQCIHLNRSKEGNMNMEANLQ